MKKKKLQLSTIKVKSFTAILPTEQQRTAKGGAAMIDNRIRNGKGSWTEVKSGKESVPDFILDSRLRKGDHFAR